ncbi:unnamed protein product [Trichobilharzia szidati]|nr:unnamed protein product [Trichobilharzia szidati]
MDAHKGPPIFNHFVKEKPQTTNQQYGFFYRAEQSEGNKKEEQHIICETLESIEKDQKKPKWASDKPLLAKKVTYYTAPPLKKYRKECEVSSGRKEPDTRLTRVKGIQLWHAHTGSLVNVKPC